MPNLRQFIAAMRERVTVENIQTQIKEGWGSYVFIGSLSTLLLGIVLILRIWLDVPFPNLTGDLAVRANLPAYTGFLSQFGLFLWSATTTIAIFSARLIARKHGSAHTIRFLFMGAMITLVLGLDDAFMLHEEVFPTLGIPEKATYVFYGLIMLSWLIVFYELILKTDYVLLAIALFFFGLSTQLDGMELRAFLGYFVEDGAKVIGILAWLAYFYRVAKASIP